MAKKKSRRMSVFVDTMFFEVRRLSLEASGAYHALLYTAYAEDGVLVEANVANLVLGIQTNKWRKIKAELLEKGFIVLVGDKKIAIRHFINDGEMKGVCPQVIDEQVIYAAPQAAIEAAHTAAIGAAPIAAPPATAGKPAENLTLNFPSISISNSIAKVREEYTDQNSIKSDDEIFVMPDKIGNTDLSDFGKVFEAIVEAEPNLQIVSTALIYSWLANGCSPELDIIPTVQRMIKKAGPGAVKSLKYFDAAIQQSKVDRQSSPLQLTPSARKNNVPSPYKVDQNIDYARGWTGDPSMVIGGLSDARN